MDHGICRLASALLVAAAATAVQAQTSDVPAPSTEPAKIHHEQWVRLPVAEDMHRVYPPEARRDNVKGRAVMVCGVTAQGRLLDCAVSDETPANYGFGAAALRLAPYFRVGPTTAEGLPTAGGTITVPVVFNWDWK